AHGRARDALRRAPTQRAVAAVGGVARGPLLRGGGGGARASGFRALRDQQLRQAGVSRAPQPRLLAWCSLFGFGLGRLGYVMSAERDHPLSQYCRTRALPRARALAAAGPA